MALWLFRTPARESVPLDTRHPLWRRIKTPQGVAVLRHADGTWAEYSVLPQMLDANADYVFGRTDRSSVPRGRGTGVSQDGSGANLETPESREYRSPLRIYRGGHVYTLDDTLKAELEAAVTEQEPGGYGAYMVASSLPDLFSDTFTDTFGEVLAQPVLVGDEILVSGRTPEYEQAAVR